MHHVMHDDKIPSHGWVVTVLDLGLRDCGVKSWSRQQFPQPQDLPWIASSVSSLLALQMKQRNNYKTPALCYRLAHVKDPIAKEKYWGKGPPALGSNSYYSRLVIATVTKLVFLGRRPTTQKDSLEISDSEGIHQEKCACVLFTWSSSHSVYYSNVKSLHCI